MIDAKKFILLLEQYGVNFYTGVPDSQIKPVTSCIFDTYGIGDTHIVTNNEGSAVALASGHYISSEKLSLVYMQNSGLGNCVNPITSLTHSDVYGIPIIYLIGHRGKIKDEPQHVKMGKITEELLALLDIDFYVVTKNSTIENIEEFLKVKNDECIKKGRSIAFIAEVDVFEYDNVKFVNENKLTREEAILNILKLTDEEDIFVSTTGKTSREVFECREQLNQPHDKDFLTVGAMGYSSVIANKIAHNKPNKKVFCLDGDGALLMNLGSMPIITSFNNKNYVHILFNNNSHESVGGLYTPTKHFDFCKIASDFGYKKTFKFDNVKEIIEFFGDNKNMEGPVFVEINVGIFSRKNLGRPTISPQDNIKNLIKAIN